jgi:hypothetical protein
MVAALVWCSKWGVQAQAPSKVWDKRFGGTSNDFGNAVAAAQGGGYVVAGESFSGQNGDKSEASEGGWDYWVVKVDENGNKVWDKSIGGTSEDRAYSITPSPDGGFVIAGYSESAVSGDKTQASKGGKDYWLVKIDQNGNKVWDRTFGGNLDDRCRAVVAAPGGGYVVTGWSQSGISGDKTEASRGGAWDYWVIKVDEAGNKVWDKTFGGDNSDFGEAIVPAAGGGYVVFGYSASAISGDKTQASYGGTFDYWVIKLDESGNKVWDKRFGGNGSEEASTICQATGGGYMLGGLSGSGLGNDKSQALKGGNDFWVLKINESGDKVWDAAFGGSSSEETPLALLPVSSDGYILVGASGSNVSGDKTEPSKGSRDYWVFKIDESGGKVWDKTFGGSSSDDPGGIVAGSIAGEYVLVGTSESPISGDKSEAPQGPCCLLNDYWVVKIQLPNAAPTDITLSPTSIAENNTVNAVVGTFTTTDPDAGDSHTYSLVSGAGDADNASFTISGDQLRANISFDFELKNSYSIRVRTTDQGNLAYEKVFTITITDVPEGGGPTISLVPVTLPVSANEGPGFLEYRIDVVLSGATIYPVSVQFNTSGTAIRAQAAGVNASCGSKTVRDYTITPSTASGPVTLTWSSALTSVAKQLRIRINGDDCLEPDETITITLFNAVNATLGTSTFTHTIVNDDAPRLGEDSELEALTTSLTLYPNPTQGALTLAFRATAESVERLQVLDVACRVVHTQTVHALEGRNEVALDLSAQPAGVYFVQALGQTTKVVLAK